MYDLKNIKNDELLVNTKAIAASERKLQLKLLYHLREIETRKLYLKIGFSSLYDYVCQELKYSGSSAYRRIQAMRLLKEIPEVETKLAEGSINLTTAAQLQSFLKSVPEVSIVSKAEKAELINNLENKSTREVERHLLGLQGGHFVPKEKVRQVTENLVEIKIVIPEELKQTLDELKLKLSHVNPNMTYQDLIQYLATKALKGTGPRKPAVHKKHLRQEVESTQRRKETEPQEAELAQREREAARLDAEPAPEVSSRYVSAELRRKVFQRDQGCCTYTDFKSGRRCRSKFQLQIDHIQPFALGGKTEEANLRVLCANHNRLRAKITFGARYSH